MIRVGLERLMSEERYRRLVDGRRVGMLVNPTSVDRRLRHAIDLAVASGWNLVRLFGPEHGVRGEAQDMEAVDLNVDPITGLPCVSLYGHSEESLTPTRSALEGVDVLIIDLQDIGARYYTYIYTAAFCAGICGDLGIDVIVCDRPNPLGGEVVEGNVVLDPFRSFVGEYPLATRHGMTFGELMGFFQRFGGLSCDLTVVPMEGWRRSMWYDESGFPWVMPSPNMPTLETAVVYPGQCLLEGTNLSEGRGTTRPFELFGAPWLDAPALGSRLTAKALPGCDWRLAGFKPMFQKHALQGCRGLQLHVRDRDVFRSVLASVALLQEVSKLHPEAFAWRTEAYEFVEDRLAIDLLLGDRSLREALEAGMALTELEALMGSAREGFEAQRQDVLIYA